MPLDMTYDGPADKLLDTHPELRGKYVHAEISVDLPDRIPDWDHLFQIMKKTATRLPEEIDPVVFSRENILADYQ